jgi:cobalt/nickel transport system permease protein
VIDGIDPAAKLIAFLAAGAVVATTPGWQPGTLALFSGLAGILLIVFAPPRRVVARRLLAVSPVVLLSGAARAWQTGDWTAGAAVAAKAGLVVLLFAVLTTTTPVPALLQSMRRLGMPKAVGSVIALMERYIHLMGGELRRMRRARASRTVQAMGIGERFRSEGQLLGALLLRSWNRSDRVHQAMLARGYAGDWPGGTRGTWRLREVAFLAAMAAGFGWARWI